MIHILAPLFIILLIMVNLPFNHSFIATSMQALEEAKIKATKLNKLVDQMEANLNKPQIVAKNLVASFLIPDIQRSKVQKQRIPQKSNNNIVQYQQNRFLVSANHLVKQTSKHAIANLGKTIQFYIFFREL